MNQCALLTYSRSSHSRCAKLSGSLKLTGIATRVRSCVSHHPHVRLLIRDRLYLKYPLAADLHCNKGLSQRSTLIANTAAGTSQTAIHASSRTSRRPVTPSYAQLRPFAAVDVTRGKKVQGFTLPTHDLMSDHRLSFCWGRLGICWRRGGGTPPCPCVSIFGKYSYRTSRDTVPTATRAKCPRRRPHLRHSLWSPPSTAQTATVVPYHAHANTVVNALLG